MRGEAAPERSEYPDTEHIPKTIITTPGFETIFAPYSGSSDPGNVQMHRLGHRFRFPQLEQVLGWDRRSCLCLASEVLGSGHDLTNDEHLVVSNSGACYYGLSSMQSLLNTHTHGPKGTTCLAPQARRHTLRGGVVARPPGGHALPDISPGQDAVLAPCSCAVHDPCPKGLPHNNFCALCMYCMAPRSLWG